MDFELKLKLERTIFTGCSATCIVTNSNGSCVYTGSSNGKVERHDTETGEVIEFARMSKGKVSALAISRNNEWIVAGNDEELVLKSSDGLFEKKCSVKCLDMENIFVTDNGKKIVYLRVKDHDTLDCFVCIMEGGVTTEIECECVYHMAMNADGSLIMLTQADQLWKIVAPDTKLQLVGDEEFEFAITDSGHLVTYTKGKVSVRYGDDFRASLNEFSVNDRFGPGKLEVSRDATTILTTTGTRRICIWRKGCVPLIFDHPDDRGFYDIVMSSDGTKVITCGVSFVKIFSLTQTGGAIQKTVDGNATSDEEKLKMAAELLGEVIESIKKKQKMIK